MTIRDKQTARTSSTQQTAAPVSGEKPPPSRCALSRCPNCGAILDNSFANGIKQNTSNEFSGTRFWAGIVIVILFCGYMGFLSYKSKETYDQRQESNVAELNLAIITEYSVKSVAVHTGTKEKIKCLTKPYQDQFIKLARKMPPAQYFGHHMDQNKSIHIDAGNVGKFSLVILSRGQEVHAEFKRYEDRERSLVVYYDAADLLEWMMNLPVNALQGCSTDISQ